MSYRFVVSGCVKLAQDWLDGADFLKIWNEKHHAFAVQTSKISDPIRPFDVVRIKGRCADEADFRRACLNDSKQSIATTVKSSKTGQLTRAAPATCRMPVLIADVCRPNERCLSDGMFSRQAKTKHQGMHPTSKQLYTPMILTSVRLNHRDSSPQRSWRHSF